MLQRSSFVSEMDHLLALTGVLYDDRQEFGKANQHPTGAIMVNWWLTIIINRKQRNPMKSKYFDLVNIRYT